VYCTCETDLDTKTGGVPLWITMLLVSLLVDSMLFSMLKMWLSLSLSSSTNLSSTPADLGYVFFKHSIKLHFVFMPLLLMKYFSGLMSTLKKEKE
jgi:hypothetical protein